MPIDYETEYDNRARVPEHPAIFARWEQEAAAFRAARPDARLGLSYGPSPRQYIDLFPGRDAADDAPLAMFIHGGWWRTLDPRMYSQLAACPNAQGVTVAVAGYDLCPTVSIATIIEQLRAACLDLWRGHKKRIFVYGHSAGGHLAACMAATDWRTIAPDAPRDLVPAAYALSGVFDLSPLPKISVNADLRLTDATARAISPIHWTPPAGRSLDIAVGAIESAEFLRQSKAIVDAWRPGGTQMRYAEIAGANHFTVVDPLTDRGSAMSQRVVELARQVQAMPL